MAACQQFNLKWNNHTNNILTVFNEHLASESLVDVTLSCEGHFLKVHKMVLSACSPYFQDMFRTPLHQVPNAVIIMSGMKFNDVKLVVDFMYRGEIKVQETELDGLLAVAESLQVKGLSNVRNKYEKGDIENSQQQPCRVLVPGGDSLPQQVATPLHLRRKRRKLSEEQVANRLGAIAALDGSPTEAGSSNGQTLSTQPLNKFVPVTMSSFHDDDLPAMIKVEPPDIRDIDEEPPATQSGWDSPKLVIDMMEEQGQSSEDRTGMPKRMVVNSVIVKRGRGRPRKSKDDMEPDIVYQPALQQPKNFVRVKQVGMPLKKLPPGSPTPWIIRKRSSKIPRPPNAFMIFANEYRRKLAYDNPSESNKDISVRLGIMWKNLPTEVKETYYTQSRTADEEHKRKYPGYYYSPKEARIRKNLKHDMAVARRGPKSLDTNYLVNVMMPDENDSLPSYLMLQSQQSGSTTTLTKKVFPPTKRPTTSGSESGSEVCIPGDFVTVKIEEGGSVKFVGATEKPDRVATPNTSTSKENDSPQQPKVTPNKVVDPVNTAPGGLSTKAKTTEDGKPINNKSDAQNCTDEITDSKTTVGKESSKNK